jgi:hypothetical protein
MWINSAIPIVQQKRGALIYKYHCADLLELHNYTQLRQGIRINLAEP